ncbi:hypothetical protein QJS66_01210 [Kocuria rhizophila]|nr:hypothetical protein QJS66_01210 [Kocuria rhizophila]
MSRVQAKRLDPSGELSVAAARVGLDRRRVSGKDADQRTTSAYPLRRASPSARASVVRGPSWTGGTRCAPRGTAVSSP